jgi:hypothetical protein
MWVTGVQTCALPIYDYYDEDFDYLCKTKNCCKGCGLEKIKQKYDDSNNIICEYLCCNSFHRKDGKNVFYKLVDYPINNKPVKKIKGNLPPII